jgi:hypothetical protein
VNGEQFLGRSERVIYYAVMPPRSRPLLVLAVAIAWLVLGPLAVLYGTCVIMCDTCDITCPAAPGVGHAPRIDSVAVLDEASVPMGEPYLTIALTPPAPPPKLLLSA